MPDRRHRTHVDSHCRAPSDSFSADLHNGAIDDWSGVDDD